MKVNKTPIPDLMIVETQAHSDNRGAFTRLYCKNELQESIGSRKIVQVNHSRTHALGAVRGLHFQTPPYAEMKLVRCIKGKVWDVAVDLRASSPTYLKWHAEELSADNRRMMVIPEGFAHGFQTLELDSELLYLHTAFYAPEAEGGIAYADSQLAITWPLPIADISNRDQQLPSTLTNFSGINI